MNMFKVFVIKYNGGRGEVRVSKKSKESAIHWFMEWYPHRQIIDVYEQ